MALLLGSCSGKLALPTHQILRAGLVRGSIVFGNAGGRNISTAATLRSKVSLAGMRLNPAEAAFAISLRDLLGKRGAAFGTVRRKFGNFIASGRLARLESEAGRNENNARKQAAYYAELVKEDPLAVVKRYESGNFAVNEACTKEYVKALALTNKLDKVNMSKLASAVESNSGVSGGFRGMTSMTESSGRSFSSNSSNEGRGGRGDGRSSGTEEEPMHVVMQEPGVKSQLWKTVRMLIIAFLLMSGLHALMEDRGLTKGMGIHNEIEPQSSSQTYRFSDVRGVDEAKEELVEIVEFLRNPDQFTRLGGKLPRGVLLMGPPGTGKTLLARAIAGEAGVPFFYCSGSEFDEMFVGVGARRVRELFASAKKKSPCIIFIDEIDAIGGTRNPKDQQFVKMTLNQLLVELDGFSQTEGVIVIGATNFPESLDKALIRPGRFDRHIVVPTPDVKGREEILELHTKDKPLKESVDLRVIARGTPGFSGAELQNLVNQAALKASVDGHQSVSMEDLEYAKDKILMGAERKNAVIEEKNRKLVAYHEGGHALVAIKTEGAMPVHKATIMPRGRALGMVSQLPESDELSWSRTQLLARLAVCMGGRAAEELIFGDDHITSGASNDIEQATNLARTMVTKYGMSKKVGLLLYKEEEINSLSTETRTNIDTEMKSLTKSAYMHAQKILSENEQQLHRLANALLEYETLTAAEIKMVIDGKKIREGEQTKSTKNSSSVKHSQPQLAVV
eukprot:Nk52_evm57s359 gene=Nk52_evmTU57s359